MWREPREPYGSTIFWLGRQRINNILARQAAEGSSCRSEKLNQKVPPPHLRKQKSELLKIIPDLDTLPKTSIPEK